MLNYNGWEDTIECLNSLLRVNYQNYKIIIVDNNSTNESVEMMRSWILNDQKISLRCLKSVGDIFQESGSGTSNCICKDIEIILIQSDINRGFSGENNIGIEYAINNNGDYILLLNNDTTVDSEFLTPLVKVLEEDNSVGIASEKIYDYYNRNDYIGGGYMHMAYLED